MRKNKNLKKEIFRVIIYYLFLQVYYLSKFLPSIYYKYISILWGNFAFFVMRKSRKRIIKNLNIAFKDELTKEEKEKIARHFFSQIILNFLELIKITKIPFSEYQKMLIVEGEENLKKALSEKKGVVGVCCHLGNFPIMQTFLAKKGYPISMIVRHSNNIYLSRFNNRLLKQLKVPFVTKWNLKEAIDYSKKWIRKGGIVCFYLDQHAGNGVEVDFFGEKVFTPVGAGVFARKYKCPVVGIFTYRIKNGKHKVVIEGPYKFNFTSDTRKDIENMSAFFMKRVEHYIRKNPDQWFTWLHRRFR